MPAAPDGAALSEDGLYWWDGESWQSIADEGDGLAVDLAQYPNLNLMYVSGEDFDTFLTYLGIDPADLVDDGDGAEDESEEVA